MIKEILPFAQITVAVLLTISILLQQRGQALGSAFGGSGDFYGTRRGVQKKIFIASIVLGALFIIVSIFNLGL